MRTRVLWAAGVAATATVATRLMLQQRPPGGRHRWERTNFRGRRVDLLGGLATAAGTVSAAGTSTNGRMRAGALLATATAAALGTADDLDTEAGASKGLRGHVSALARGEVTTGAVKLLGITSASLLAAALASPPSNTTRPWPIRLSEVVISGGLIAGTANLINLFDLRPGRGLKVTALLAAPIAVTPSAGAAPAAGALGVVTASWSTDLAEETMLGDAGANALGALVGFAFAVQPNGYFRLATLAGVSALTVLSERISFSAVIASTPVLRHLDQWGRRGDAGQ